MKLLIASDIHGAAGYCRQLLDAWDREGADRLLLLGDVLYHGPRNDLPPDYAPKEVIALLNARKDKIFCGDGVVHYCVANMPGGVPRTSTYALNNATLPYALAIANKGIKQALLDDPHLLNGLNVCKGQLTYKAVADAQHLAYVPALDAVNAL